MKNEQPSETGNTKYQTEKNPSNPLPQKQTTKKQKTHTQKTKNGYLFRLSIIVHDSRGMVMVLLLSGAG
jgi:hypothetical protein